MAGEPALPRLRQCRRRSGLRANATVERREAASRLRGTATPRKRGVASYRRDKVQGSAPPGAPPAPRFGVGADDDQGFGRKPAQRSAKAAEMRWRQSEP